MGFSKIKIMLLVLLLVSCGTKKKVVQRSSVEAVEVVNKDVQHTKINDIVSNVQILHGANTTTIKPSDPDKPSRYGNIEFENAEITQSVVKENLTTETTDKSITQILDQGNSKTINESSTVTKDIDIDRSWGVFDWLWLFLAILIVVIGIRMYMKKINPLEGLKKIIGIK